MKLRDGLALLIGTGLAALGCGSNALQGGGGGHGGSAGQSGADASADSVYGRGCLSDLFVDWQIQNPAAGAVTCDAVHATEVVVNIDGVNYPQTCPAGHSFGNQDIVLQRNDATYFVTVNLEDVNGEALAVPQSTSIDVTSCGSYQTPGPAILVVAPPAQ